VRDELFYSQNLSTIRISGIAYAKIWEELLAVGTILVLVRFSGDDLTSVYLMQGKME